MHCASRLPICCVGAVVSGARNESYVQRAMPLYLALLFAILTVFVIYVLLELRQVLLILFISLLFASAVSGPSKRLERLHVPRAIAALLVYAAALGIFVIVVWLVVPPLLEQLAAFGDRAPQYVDRYDRLRGAYERLARDYPGLGSFDAQVAALGARLVDIGGKRLLALPGALFTLFLDALSVFTISMLLLGSREKLLAFTLALVNPRHRATTERVLVGIWRRVGAYLRAKLIVMAIIGAITYGVLLLIGVPYAILLAVVVAFGELIPRAGPWIARIPLLGIAALEGWSTFGLTFAASIVIENAKGYAISPFVEGDQLDIPPLLVFVSVLVGATLLGVAGAFVAVPFAAMAQVLFEEVIIPWRQAQLSEEAPP